MTGFYLHEYDQARSEHAQYFQIWTFSRKIQPHVSGLVLWNLGLFWFATVFHNDSRHASTLVKLRLQLMKLWSVE